MSARSAARPSRRLTSWGRRPMAGASGARPAESLGAGARRVPRVGACQSRGLVGRGHAGAPGPAARARGPGRSPGAHAPGPSRARPRTAHGCGVGGETGRRWSRLEGALGADTGRNCKEQEGRGSKCAFWLLGAGKGGRGGQRAVPLARRAGFGTECPHRICFTLSLP